MYRVYRTWELKSFLTGTHHNFIIDVHLPNVCSYKNHKCIEPIVDLWWLFSVSGQFTRHTMYYSTDSEEDETRFLTSICQMLMYQRLYFHVLY